MKYINIVISSFLLCCLAACAPSSVADHGAPACPSVKILSTIPEISTPLHVGEHVKLQVDISYTLTANSGTLGLVVEAADNSNVTGAMEGITKGSGTLALQAEFVVPSTKVIQVFTPLSAQGQTSTTTVDWRAFKVVRK